MKKRNLAVGLVVLAVACGGEEEAVEAIAPGTGAAPVEPGATAEPAAAEENALTPPPPMPTVELTPEQTALKDAMVAALGTREFLPRDVTSEKTNGPIFLHLAATSDTENVLIASLKALIGSWSVDPDSAERGYNIIDDTFVDVVLNRIRDERPKVQAAAIDAGGVGFRRTNTNERLLAAYLELGTSGSPQLRYAVMDRIWQSRMPFETEERIAIFVDALDAPEPWLVSSALFRLDGNIPRDVAWAVPLRDKILELTRHADPGVRGRAARALATLAGRLPEADPARIAATARLVEMMDDENPYTKSEGISAQRTLNNISAIPAIAAHLDDATPNTYDIRGWQTLAGSSGWSHHDGSAWSQVRDAALYAIKSMSYRIDRDNRFDYRISGQTKDEDLASAVTAAREWIAAHSDAISGAGAE